jgi:hypothetical protein
MNARQFIKVAVVSIISLLLTSDFGYAEPTRSAETSIFRPVSADFGADHFHMELLSFERNLIETENNSYINGQVTLYERFNLATGNLSKIPDKYPWQQGRIFDALIVPGIEIGRRFEKGPIRRAGFFGTAAYITPNDSYFFNTGFMVQSGPVQLKAGVFRGTIHYEASHRDNLDDLSLKKPYDELTAVSYITVGLSPTFSF